MARMVIFGSAHHMAIWRDLAVLAKGVTHSVSAAQWGSLRLSAAREAKYTAQINIQLGTLSLDGGEFRAVAQHASRPSWRDDSGSSCSHVGQA